MNEAILLAGYEALSREVEFIQRCKPTVEVHPWKVVVEQKYLTGRYLRLVDHKVDREVIICRTTVANDESYSISFNRERKAFVITNGGEQANWSRLSRFELACLIVYLEQAQDVGMEPIPESVLRKIITVSNGGKL